MNICRIPALGVRSGLMAILSLGVSCCALAGDLHGRVFIDANGNGKLDEGEAGAPGVAMSDGLAVVKTDATGSYRLPGIPAPRFLLLTQPDGFEAPALFQRVVAGQDNYDFALVKSARDERQGISFVHITDTETDQYGPWIDDLKDYVKDHHPAFLVHTGDICYDPQLRFHAKEVVTATIGCPVFYCRGNHDGHLFLDLFGPSAYSFDRGGIHFVVTPMSPGKEVFAWLKADLAAADGKPTVIFNHNLWVTDPQKMVVGGVDLAKHDLRAFVYGHWHNSYMKQVGQVLTISAAPPDKEGIDHSLSSFQVVRISPKGEVSVETRATHIRRHLVPVAPGDGDTVHAPGGRLPVTITAYHTPSPTRSVRIAVAPPGQPTGPWQELKPSGSWSWNGFCETVVPGVYRLESEATFENGEKIDKTTSFTLAAAPLPKGIPGEDWNQLRGNSEHTAASPLANNGRPELAWTADAGGHVWMAAPIVAGGRVFVATLDDDARKACGFHAFDAATGTRLWDYKTRNSVKNTIVHDAGRVLGTDQEGWIYAIDAATGRLAWEKHLPVAFLPGLVDGLAAKDGIVYAGSGTGLCALEVATGKVLWTNKGWSQAEGSVPTLTLVDGVLVASAHWRALYGLDAKTGGNLWSLGRSQGLSFRNGTVAGYDQQLLVAEGDLIQTIDPRTGKVLRAGKAPFKFGVAAAPLQSEKLLVTGSTDAGIVALDRKTLATAWTFKTGKSLFCTSPYSKDGVCTANPSPILVGHVVYAGASDGCAYGLDLETGALRWRRDLGSPVLAAPAVSGQLLFIVDFAGNLQAFRLRP